MVMLANPSKSNTRTRFLPGKSVVIADFLPPEKYHEILDFALHRQDVFKASATVTEEADYRRSLVAYHFDYPIIYQWLKHAILKHFPRVCHQLQRSYFPISDIEMQMTAHNDGNFYKLHNDSGCDQTFTRELTYVYYFYQEPCAFTGGELWLYDTELDGKHPIAQTKTQTIQPANNSIVFFNSDCQHEVRPVYCPSREFQDSRFTLNGWLRR